ncbi:MAG: nuclear transport factor 2 family protein [Gammaproteobacteria bacterium]
MTGNLGDGRIVVGTARTERADAIDLARNWLDAMWRRDLPAAAGMMAPGARVTISGGHQFVSLEAFAAFAAGRYADFRKRADAFEACEAAGGLAVYVRGTASGSFNDGAPFSAVRWCDRFLVAQGRIVDIETWSDLAETRAGTAAMGAAET